MCVRPPLSPPRACWPAFHYGRRQLARGLFPTACASVLLHLQPFLPLPSPSSPPFEQSSSCAVLFAHLRLVMLTARSSHRRYTMKTFLFAALVSAPLASAAMGDCYFPGGTWAAGFKPCNPYAVTTSCCQAGWTCMSNTICALTDPAAASNQSPWGSVQRASCTNPQWNDTACGNFCKSMNLHSLRAMMRSSLVARV